MASQRCGQLEEGCHRFPEESAGSGGGCRQQWRRLAVIISAVACLAAAASVWRSGSSSPVVALSDFRADSEDNVFSSHYLSPERRKSLATHPPPKPKAAVAPPPPPPPRPAARQRRAALDFSRSEAKEVVDEIPGMGAREMSELVHAATFGHAKVVQPVPAVKPAKLSAKRIAQENIRADDIFSQKYYHRAVPTAGDYIPNLHPDSELHSMDGEAAAVMREAGKAFAMAEGGEHLPSEGGKERLSSAKMQVYKPAQHTITLASVNRGQSAQVPAVDQDLISSLDTDESEIDHMHIMTSAQRAVINPDSVEDIDSELLKKSINGLTSMNQQAERTGRQYKERSRGQEQRRRQERAREHLNGDEGAHDLRTQMDALGRQALPKEKHASSTEAFASALQPGQDSAFNRAMRAAVKASNPVISDEDIPIGDAKMGDDSGGDDQVLEDEQHEVRTERAEDRELDAEASPMWPSEGITRREEEREARKKRELEDRERKIDEHEKQLEQDAKAAARAQARAKREAAEAKKARNEAAAEQRKEEEAREEEARSRELEKRVERQMAAFAGSEQPRKVHATHALAAQAGEGKATASGKEEESVQWKRAKEAAEKRKEAEERAHEQAEAARKAKKEKERKLWAAAEAERQKQQEKRARMEEQERRHKEERKEEFLQAARARRDEQRAEHAQVQPQQDSVAHSGLGTDRAEADDIERQVEALKNQLMDSANKKAAERRAMEKKEAEEQARTTGRLHDLQTLSKHVTEGLDLHPAAASPAPAPVPAPTAVPAGNPSWGNLISFMEGSGSAAPAPAAKEKARFRAAEHAQSLALSRSDKEAEKAAMEKAEEQAEDKEDEGGRQAAANVLSGMEDDTSSGGGHSRDKTQLSDKNFNKFLAHYHQTQAKEKQYARLMKTHMADEKQDEMQVKKLQAEKEKSEGAGDSSLLKVAEVLSSVGAGSFLSSAMGASKKAIPTPVASIGAGAALAHEDLARDLKADPVADK